MFERFRAGRAAKRAVRAGDFAALVALLGDPDHKVRANTENACMLLEPGSAPSSLVGALLHAAADPEGEVRGQAILALGSIRSPEAPSASTSASSGKATPPRGAGTEE